LKPARWSRLLCCAEKPDDDTPITTGEAEAAAIEARAKALGTNPNLVTLVQAESASAFCRRRWCPDRPCRLCW
jgi:hypothetical protein